MKIEDLEKALQYFVIAVPESEEQAKAYFWARKALTALRSATREQLEKVWRGEWQDTREAYNDVPKRRCSRCKSVFIGLDTPFCEVCGAPMTDEAVEMVMERLGVVFQ